MSIDQNTEESNNLQPNRLSRRAEFAPAYQPTRRAGAARWNICAPWGYPKIAQALSEENVVDEGSCATKDAILTAFRDGVPQTNLVGSMLTKQFVPSNVL